MLALRSASSLRNTMGPLTESDWLLHDIFWLCLGYPNVPTWHLKLAFSIWKDSKDTVAREGVWDIELGRPENMSQVVTIFLWKGSRPDGARISFPGISCVAN